MSPLQKELFSQFGANSGYIEEIYERYKIDPSLVGDYWTEYFARLEGMLGEAGVERELPPATPKEPRYSTSLSNSASLSSGNGQTHSSNGASARQAPVDSDILELQERVNGMVNAYRRRGHLVANINPLTQGIVPLPEANVIKELRESFSEEELDQEVRSGYFGGKETWNVRKLIGALEEDYCGPIGFEYQHLVSQEERRWFRAQIEREDHEYDVSDDERLRVLKKVIEAEAFESNLHTKYIGHKRFSLQGGEALIPMLDIMLDLASNQGVDSAVIGMAHRGRLNVLANIMGKPLRSILSEFEDQNEFTSLGSGDVKYHMGFLSQFNGLSTSDLELELAPNPSHLEFVNPVVEGMVRARQDKNHAGDRSKVLPVLIHGDAAVVGQGVVTETYNLSNVNGYTTGGTIHIVVNNQIGFTTNPDEARSTVYCTDWAKAIQAPVMHVNCEDPEAACWAMKLALAFRQRYKRDVVVDLYCYRKYGHNEGDDPSFTQPLVYNEIKSKKPVSKIYAERLVTEGLVEDSHVKEFLSAYNEEFDTSFSDRDEFQIAEACSTVGKLRIPTPDTGVEYARLEAVADSLITYPDGFVPHPKLHKILEKRIASLKEDTPIDWGFAENLAFGSLLQDGVSVRLSGQDCGRGTFSQRHLALNNYEKPEIISPIGTVAVDGASFEVINSTLSEAAVVGFEFGYSSTADKALVLWEGQFGDFVNGAQVHIDQFLSSSEAKWNQFSGLVMLLPHGLEGQGPEHSSARLERFLQLCGEGNMVVAYPSNAAQYFHLIRTQGLLDIKRPLIVMTPKSHLRSAEAACAVSDLTEGQFQHVLVDHFGNSERAETVVFTTGKVFHDFARALREEDLGDTGVVVIRVEQLYPFPQYEIKQALKGLDVDRYVWVQEEPQNMGAWSYIEPYLRGKLEAAVHYLGRPAAASPATGSGKRHAQEQRDIVDALLEFVAG